MGAVSKGVPVLKRILAGWALVGMGLVLLAACTGVPDRPEPARLDLGAASTSDAAAAALLLDPVRREALLSGAADPEQSAEVVRRGTRTGTEGERATAALVAALPGLDRPGQVAEPLSDAVLDVVIHAFPRGPSSDPEIGAVTGFVAASGDDDARRTWTALRLGAEQELARGVGAGELPARLLQRVGALDGALVAARAGQGTDEAADTAAAFRCWSAAAEATAAAMARRTGPEALLAVPGEPLPPAVVRELERQAGGNGGSVEQWRSSIHLDVPYREQRLVVDAALAAGEDLALPAGAVTVGTPVPQLAGSASASTIEQAYDRVKDRLDLDEGGYADGFRSAFPPP